jgi:hypothetical protein
LRTNAFSLVFTESLVQGKAMLHSFTYDANNNSTPTGKEPIVEDLNHWTMTAALYVLSGAAFNLKMIWPTHSVLAPPAENLPSRISGDTSSSSHHKISFQQSLEFLDLLAYVILLPKWMMRYSPFGGMRHLLTCTEEFVLYVRELIASAEENSSKSDLLSAIVKAGKGSGEKTALSETETIGNMFLFIVAGHETSSNTMHTALLMLACEPKIQADVHEEIEGIWTNKKDDEDWCYETDYPKMRVLMAVIVCALFSIFSPLSYTDFFICEKQSQVLTILY